MSLEILDLQALNELLRLPKQVIVCKGVWEALLDAQKSQALDSQGCSFIRQRAVSGSLRVLSRVVGCLYRMSLHYTWPWALRAVTWYQQ